VNESLPWTVGPQRYIRHLTIHTTCQ